MPPDVIQWKTQNHSCIISSKKTKVKPESNCEKIINNMENSRIQLAWIKKNVNDIKELF